VCAQLPLRGPARVGIQRRLWCCRGIIGGLLPRRWRNWVVRWSVHPYLHWCTHNDEPSCLIAPSVGTRPRRLSRRPPGRLARAGRSTRASRPGRCTGRHPGWRRLEGFHPDRDREPGCGMEQLVKEMLIVDWRR